MSFLNIFGKKKNPKKEIKPVLDYEEMVLVSVLLKEVSLSDGYTHSSETIHLNDYMKKSGLDYSKKNAPEKFAKTFVKINENALYQNQLVSKMTENKKILIIDELFKMALVDEEVSQDEVDVIYKIADGFLQFKDKSSIDKIFEKYKKEQDLLILKNNDNPELDSILQESAIEYFSAILKKDNDQLYDFFLSLYGRARHRKFKSEQEYIDTVKSEFSILLFKREISTTQEIMDKYPSKYTLIEILKMYESGDEGVTSEDKTEIMMLHRMASNLLKPRSEWFSKILNDYNKNRFPDYEIADHMYSFYIHIANILGERIISLKEG